MHASRSVPAPSTCRPTWNLPRNHEGFVDLKRKSFSWAQGSEWATDVRFSAPAGFGPLGIAASKLDAERDGVKVPETVEEYVVPTAPPPSPDYGAMEAMEAALYGEPMYDEFSGEFR
ncbi:Ubiquitin conjugating enzyme protein 3 [Aphelenchoides fujianensis]|nr:Ubiquitin conjugating enzyme protein 3 [Aphelenchoides fujianensis]